MERNEYEEKRSAIFRAFTSQLDELTAQYCQSNRISIRRFESAEHASKLNSVMVKHPEASEMFMKSAVFKSSIEAIVRGQSEIYCLVEVCKMMDKQTAAWVDHVMVCPAPQMRTK